MGDKSGARAAIRNDINKAYEALIRLVSERPTELPARDDGGPKGMSAENMRNSYSGKI